MKKIITAVQIESLIAYLKQSPCPSCDVQTLIRTFSSLPSLPTPEPDSPTTTNDTAGTTA